MKKLIFFLLLINFQVFAEKLNEEEKIFFNFIDLNNDKKISYQEADQVLKLIFQLLDDNNDNNISEKEILELKKIIEFF